MTDKQCKFHYNGERVCFEQMDEVEPGWGRINHKMCPYHIRLIERKSRQLCTVISGTRDSFQFVCNNKCTGRMFCDKCYDNNKMAMANTIVPIPAKNAEYSRRQRAQLENNHLLKECQMLLEKYKEENRMLKIRLQETTHAFAKTQEFLIKFVQARQICQLPI